MLEKLLQMDKNGLLDKELALETSLKESFNKYGNQILLQEENDCIKSINESLIEYEDEKNILLIQNILLKEQLLKIQNKMTKNISTLTTFQEKVD